MGKDHPQKPNKYQSCIVIANIKETEGEERTDRMSSLFAQHAGEEEKEGVKRNLQRLPDSQSVILSTGTRKLRLKS